MEISLSPLQTEQGVLICSIIRDASARKALETELEANRMKVVSSARLSALGMMAGGIAHEINNPLGIIHAYASDLREMDQQESISPADVERTSARIVEAPASASSNCQRASRRVSARMARSTQSGGSAAAGARPADTGTTSPSTTVTGPSRADS